MDKQVVIVGAGLAGLACAKQLESHRIPFVMLEASDAVGGRVRTDLVDGFLLDRGFQVLLSSYPELRRWVDLPRLQLRPFLSGARVRLNGRFYELADPWRRPWTAVISLLSPVGSVSDKLRVAKLRRLSLRGTYQDRMQDPEQTTLGYLQQLGFSSQMIDSFMRPFLGGIFLDSELQTSSRMLNFVFRMFSIGNACLPANGMQTLPNQLASEFLAERIRLNTCVDKIGNKQVTLSSGEQISAGCIIVAVDGPATQRLLPGIQAAPGRGVRCLYYRATKPPFSEPILVLNGEGSGPINNLCIPSNVSTNYAPPGQSLVSVTVLKTNSELSEQELEIQVRSQLKDWYGTQTDDWRHLRTYTIPYALPDQTSPALAQPQRPVHYAEGIYICGDHRDNASIEGAMVSGRRTAEAVMKDYAGMS